MAALQQNQKVTIGFQYVLDLLTPATAYGRLALRQLRPYARDDRQALREELDNIAQTLLLREELETAYVKVERVLCQIRDIRQSIERIGGGLLDEVDLFEIMRYLLQLAELGPLLDTIERRAAYTGLRLAETSDALTLLDPEKTRIPTFHISGRYSAELTGIRAEKKAVEQRLRTAKNNEKAALTAQRGALAAREQREEEAVRKELTEKLAPFAEALLHNTGVIARLDLLLQKAALARRTGCVKPEIGGDKVTIREMTNPAIAAFLEKEGRSFTPISLELERGTTVITGANMGGKSVALRTAALNVLLAQCGFYVFAQKMQTPLFDDIYLVSEDLEAADRGLSSFAGEVVRLNEITRALPGKFVFILLDEFARGTNPEEGAAIARAVAAYLNEKDAVSVMTTHYDGVAAAASAHFQVAGLSAAGMANLQNEMENMTEREQAAAVAHAMDYGLYRVREGKKVPKDAINICKLLKCDKKILDFVENNY